MDEIEKFFRCPYCRSQISMLLDVSVQGNQSYIEDCEVCCQPIEISFTADAGELLHFTAAGTQL